MPYAAPASHTTSQAVNHTSAYGHGHGQGQGQGQGHAAARTLPLQHGYRVQVVPWRPDDADQAASPSTVNLASSSPSASPSIPPVVPASKADHISVPYLGAPRAVVAAAPLQPASLSPASQSPPATDPSYSYAAAPPLQPGEFLNSAKPQATAASPSKPSPPHPPAVPRRQVIPPPAAAIAPAQAAAPRAAYVSAGQTSHRPPKAHPNDIHHHYYPKEQPPPPRSSGRSSSDSSGQPRNPAYSDGLASPLEPTSLVSSPRPISAPPAPAPAQPQQPQPFKPSRDPPSRRQAARHSPPSSEASPRAPAVPDLAALASQAAAARATYGGSGSSSSGSYHQSPRALLEQPDDFLGLTAPPQLLPSSLELFSGRSEYTGAGGDLVSPPDSSPSSPSPSLVEALNSKQQAPQPAMAHFRKGYAEIHGGPSQGILMQLSDASDALNAAAAPSERGAGSSSTASLRRKLKEREEEIAELRARVNEFDPVLRERAGRAARQAQKELAGIQKQLAAKDAEVIVLKGVVAKLRDENATLLRRAEKAESHQKSIQSIERKARKEVEREAEARRAAQAALKQYKTVADEVKEDVKNLQGEACKLLSRKVARDKEVFNLKQKVAELQDLLAESLERAERKGDGGAKAKMQELRERNAFLEHQLQESDLRRQRDASAREQQESFAVHLLEADVKSLREEAERLALEKGKLQAQLDCERQAREDEQAERADAEEQRRLVEEEAELMAAMLCGPQAEEEYIQESMQWASLRAELEESLNTLPPLAAAVEEPESQAPRSHSRSNSRSNSRGARSGQHRQDQEQEQEQPPAEDMTSVSISLNNMKMLLPEVRAALAGESPPGAARFEEEDDGGAPEEAPRPPALVVPSGTTSPAASELSARMRPIPTSADSPRAGAVTAPRSSQQQQQAPRRPKSPFAAEAERQQPVRPKSPWGAESDASYKTTVVHTADGSPENDNPFAEPEMDDYAAAMGSKENLYDSLANNMQSSLPGPRYSNEEEDSAEIEQPVLARSASPPSASAGPAQRRAYLVHSQTMPRMSSVPSSPHNLSDIHRGRLKEQQSSSLPASPAAAHSRGKSDFPTASSSAGSSPRGALRRTHSMAAISARRHVLIEELTNRETRSGHNSPRAEGVSPRSPGVRSMHASLQRDNSGGRRHHRASSLSPSNFPASPLLSPRAS